MSEDFDRELLSQGHQVLAAAGLLVSAIRDNNLRDIEVRIAMARNALAALAESVAEKIHAATPTPSPHDQREGT
jgi:hypothetical protein